MRSKYSSRSNRFRILPNGARFERSVAIERLESGIRYNALKRAFDIDIEHCPNCGGSLKVIAAPSTRSGRDPAYFARLRPLRRRSLELRGSGARAGRSNTGFSSNRNRIDNSTARRYSSGQKKRWFKIPIQTDRGVTHDTVDLVA